MTSAPVIALLPGFSRSAEHATAMAELCREHGLRPLPITTAPRAVAPLYMSRVRLRGIAREVTLKSSGAPVVIVGHSAGAAAGCFLASTLRGESDLRGLVMVDGVDSPNGLIRRYLPDLQSLRVSAVFADATPCNRNGKLEQQMAAFPWVHCVHVQGAGHGDFEGHGLTIYTRVCGDRSTAEISREFRKEVMRQVERTLA